jgi:hypothetical protein
MSRVNDALASQPNHTDAVRCLSRQDPCVACNRLLRARDLDKGTAHAVAVI